MTEDTWTVGDKTDSRTRVVVESVSPVVDEGAFPAKAVIGDSIEVSADIFAEGHDELAAVVRYRGPGEADWRQVPMTLLVNDRWAATFQAEAPGMHAFTIEAWVDEYKSWAAKLATTAPKRGPPSAAAL